MNGKHCKWVQPLRGWYERDTLVCYINKVGVCFINTKEIIDYMIEKKWMLVKKRKRIWITRDKKIAKKWTQIHLLGE